MVPEYGQELTAVQQQDNNQQKSTGEKRLCGVKLESVGYSLFMSAAISKKIITIIRDFVIKLREFARMFRAVPCILRFVLFIFILFTV